MSSSKASYLIFFLNKDEYTVLNLTKLNIPNMFSDYEKRIEIRNKLDQGGGSGFGFVLFGFNFI